MVKTSDASSNARACARVMGSTGEPGHDVGIRPDIARPSQGPAPLRSQDRAGGCCQVRAEPGKARCRFHGGKSTGPKTQAGRARIAEAQRFRWRAYRERVRASGLR